MKKKIVTRIVGWLAGLYVMSLRLTCRTRLHNDPREGLAKQGYGVALVCLHANQLAGSLICPRGSATIVSRSADGDILVPALRWSGHVPLRGSNGTGKKGGSTALHALIEHARAGGPTMLAIDGPRGPRGAVQKGVGLLARKGKTAVVAGVVKPRRRWILTKSWDRMQMPKPFSLIEGFCADPFIIGEDESVESFVKRIEDALRVLEQRVDPEEARYFYDPATVNRMSQRHRAA